MHLEQVTTKRHGELHVGRKMNLSDAERLRRSLVSRGEASPTSKLTEPDVIAMRDERIAGATLREIAERYGCSITMVSNIVHGRAWKHLLPEAVMPS